MHKHMGYYLVRLKISGLVVMQCKKIGCRIDCLVSTNDHLRQKYQYVDDNEIEYDRGCLLKPIARTIK